MLLISSESELKNVVPRHVEEIIFYLKERGYKIECFKEMNSSKYILKYKNISVEFKSCREIVDFLARKFYEEKAVEENEYCKKLLEKCLYE